MVKTGGKRQARGDGIIKHIKWIEYLRIEGRARDSAAVYREKQKLGDRNNIRELRLWRGLKLGKPDFCFLPVPRARFSHVVHFSQFLLFRPTAAESRARPVIISNSINLVEIMIPSLQAGRFPPSLSIFEENQLNQAK